jgi:acetyl-CoA C-acetyltransferase
LIAALNGLIERCNLQGQLLGEVAGGAVIKHSREFNLMRESVLGTSVTRAHRLVTYSRHVCDTGIESAIYIANKIALGQIECGIAGGVDSSSDVPLVFGEKLRKTLLAARRAKTTGARLKLLLSIRLKDWAPVPPMNEEPRTGMSNGRPHGSNRQILQYQ